TRGAGIDHYEGIVDAPGHEDTAARHDDRAIQPQTHPPAVLGQAARQLYPPQAAVMRRPCRKAGLVVAVSLQAPVPARDAFFAAPAGRDMLPPATPPMLEAGADVAPPAQRNMQLRRQHRIITDAA